MKQKKAHASHPVGNRTVIGIICLVVALAICFGIAPLVNRLSDGKTKIVRLIRDISAGATITEADIEVADVGSYNLPTGVIKDKAQVVGKCALSNLTKGDYLFPSKIGNDTNNAGRMLESLDEKHKTGGKTLFQLSISLRLDQRQPRRGRLLKSMLFSLRNLYIAVAMRKNRRSVGRSGRVEE